jgi:hypothetical protein
MQKITEILYVIRVSNQECRNIYWILLQNIGGSRNFSKGGKSGEMLYMYFLLFEMLRFDLFKHMVLLVLFLWLHYIYMYL